MTPKTLKSEEEGKCPLRRIVHNRGFALCDEYKENCLGPKKSVQILRATSPTRLVKLFSCGLEP